MNVHMQMKSSSRLAVSVALLMALLGCETTSHRAPVEDRGRSSGGGSASSGASTAQSAPKPLPGIENAGKPGYYTVKPGDTLIRIALDAGQNWRDVAAWNNIENANLIETGQVLRIVPPGSDPNAPTLATAKPVSTPKIETRALDKSPATGKPGSTTVASASMTSTTGTASTSSSASTPSSASSSAAASTTSGSGSSSSGAAAAPDGKDDEPAWAWPANGPTLGGFEEGKRKGLAIGGKAGDPVYAAGDGRVVYAGSGLRGYGNLIIIKHSGDYLTAYAHNQALLVKEDQVVRKGQKIAEMGATDADRVQLHFEIRKQGKPIDPAKQLPSR
jgi:lipoprotein NlpD